MKSKRLNFVLGAVLLSAMSLSTVATAGPGVRVGVTDDPEALFAGLHWKFDLGQTGPGRIVLQPGADFALVDGPIDFFIRGTAHFAYVIPLSSELDIYPLAGPLALYADAGESDLGIGVDVGVGLNFKRFAIEAWFGIEDSPDLTLALSFTL